MGESLQPTPLPNIRDRGCRSASKSGTDELMGRWVITTPRLRAGRGVRPRRPCMRSFPPVTQRTILRPCHAFARASPWDRGGYLIPSEVRRSDIASAISWSEIERAWGQSGAQRDLRGRVLHPLRALAEIVVAGASLAQGDTVLEVHVSNTRLDLRFDQVWFLSWWLRTPAMYNDRAYAVKLQLQLGRRNSLCTISIRVKAAAAAFRRR